VKRRLPHTLLLSLVLLASSAGAAGAAGSPPGKQSPQNTALPVITGTGTVGSTLSASTGTWTGVSLTFAYEWSRCDVAGLVCAPIPGETRATHLIVASEADGATRVTVIAKNKNGTARATSAALAIAASTSSTSPSPSTTTPPSNTALPAVSGTLTTGQVVSTTNGTWSGSPTGYAYQWKRCDTTGAGCTAVSGATGRSYTLATADIGASMRATVTATNAAGSSSATSAATAAVAAAAPTTTSPTPAPAPSPAQNARFGFAAGGALHNFSSTDLSRYLDGAQAAHTGWVRIDINWQVIQYEGRTSYNWAPFDNVVKAVTARGMRVLAGILYTPPWARPAGTGGNYPPTNLQDYADFVRTAVARYAPMGVHAYEVWNEPNIAGFWAPGPDPARYTQLLKLAYGAIKASDGSATVVSAGLSPYGSYGQGDAQHLNPLSFLERMYQSGAAGSFDAVGWHPYNYPYGLSYYGWSAWSQMSETTPSARSIMSAGGDGAKQIWATEFGAPTGSTTRDITEAAQAQLVSDSYAKLKTWSWAGPAFFYSYKDTGTNKSDVEQNFGIIHFDWSPKASYTAYQNAAAAG
jgi:polysaccharide biosynthesis protein PslG